MWYLSVDVWGSGWSVELHELENVSGIDENRHGRLVEANDVLQRDQEVAVQSEGSRVIHPLGFVQTEDEVDQADRVENLLGLLFACDEVLDELVSRWVVERGEDLDGPADHVVERVESEERGQPAIFLLGENPLLELPPLVIDAMFLDDWGDEDEPVCKWR